MHLLIDIIQIACCLLVKIPCLQEDSKNYDKVKSILFHSEFIKKHSCCFVFHLCREKNFVDEIDSSAKMLFSATLWTSFFGFKIRLLSNQVNRSETEISPVSISLSYGSRWPIKQYFYFVTSRAIASKNMFELYLTLTKLTALYNSLEQTNAEIPEIAY